MKSTKSLLGEKTMTFNGLDKQEMHCVCGRGYFYWNSKTKEIWWIS